MLFEATGIVAPQEAGQIGHIRHIVEEKKTKFEAVQAAPAS